MTTQPSGELPVNQNCIVAGEEVSFDIFADKLVLVVNVARL